MQNKVDISVIIPMYNAGRYIESTISSILLQKKHGLRLEILVIDDASTDDSCQVVRQINDSRINLIELDKNGGTANARNKGMEIAIGAWVQFLDSDDRLAEDLYAKFELSMKPGFNCYVFSLILEKAQSTLKQTVTEIIDKRAFGYFGSVCNKFIRRDICVPFKKEYKVEDVCFIVDMMNSADLKIALIRQAYYIYNCKNEDSKNANFDFKEYHKMYSYLYRQINRSDDDTKKYILEISIGLLFYKPMPRWRRLQIAAKTTLRLFKYLPSVYKKGIRHCIESVKISS